MRLCPVCHTGPHKILMTMPTNCRAKVGRREYEFSCCPTCETVYVANEVTADDIKSQYADAIQFSAPVYRSPERVQMILQFYTAILRRFIPTLPRPLAQAKVLEVGAGLAWVCRCAKMIEPAVATMAQDLTSECINECPWVDKYVVGPIEDPLIAEMGPYDIVSMTHVIEHLPDPVSSLKRIREMMSRGAQMLVTAPHRPEGWTTASNPAVWRGWSYNHVPGHLQYFSERSLAMAAKAAGLNVRSFALGENGQSFEGVLYFG